MTNFKSSFSTNSPKCIIKHKRKIKPSYSMISILMLKKINYFFTISIPTPNYFSTLNLKLLLKRNSLKTLSPTGTQLSLVKPSGKKNSKFSKIATVLATITSGSMKKRDMILE